MLWICFLFFEMRETLFSRLRAHQQLRHPHARAATRRRLSRKVHMGHGIQVGVVVQHVAGGGHAGRLVDTHATGLDGGKLLEVSRHPLVWTVSGAAAMARSLVLATALAAALLALAGGPRGDGVGTRVCAWVYVCAVVNVCV